MYSTPTCLAPNCFSFFLRILPHILATNGLGDQDGMGRSSFTQGISFAGFFIGSMTVGWKA